MKKGFYNGIWGLGVRVLHLGKRLGISGPFESVLWQLANWLIPPPDDEVVVTLPYGLKLVIPPGFARARSYAAGTYEPAETRLVQDLLKDGMTLVDVGAFCGYYTLIASRLVNDSGRAYAFEPDPRTYAYLVRNVEANRCLNVVSVNKAVSGRTGFAALAVHEQPERNWLLPSSSAIPSIAVPSITLDDFFAARGWPSVGLIKMDIEGGETAVLLGMKELSQRNPDLSLIMEFDMATVRRSGESREHIARILLELGFHKGYVIEQGLRPFSVAGNFPRSRACYNLLFTRE